jgi:NADPH:quinone reductase-like Zn-dependent oxidoreductase
MRVAGIRSFGGPLEVIDLPDPRAPADDEVLIEIRAAGMANWDGIVRDGDWDAGVKPPMALGVAGAGVVTEVGASVGDWRAGDEVLTHPLPLRGTGTWAPWLIAPAALVAGKPAGLSWEAAGAIPVPALTAAQVIDDSLRLRAGERLLVHGAGGVTGRVLVALGALRGAEVIAIASPSGHEALQRLGAGHVVDYHDADWPDAVRAMAGGDGVDAVANAVQGGAAEAIRAVRDGGRLTMITSDSLAAERGIAVSTVYVRSDGPQLQAVVGLGLDVEVGWTFELGQAAEALRLSRGGTGGGAVVLVP